MLNNFRVNGSCGVCLHLPGMKLNELERVLAGLGSAGSPSPALEQYPTPAKIAASIVFDAAMRGDVAGRSIADLGCGAGIFAIASVLMGCESAEGFDSDPAAVAAAEENARLSLPGSMRDRVHFVNADIGHVGGRYDTVFQNPPFGAQRRNADVPFIRKALEIGNSIYTMHPAVAREFVERKVEQFGGTVEFEKSFTYEMPWMFAFHTRKVRKFELILFKVVKIHR